MSKFRKSTSLSKSGSLIADLICYPISILPASIAWIGSYLLLKDLYTKINIVWIVLILPICMFMFFLISVFLIRMLLPRMKKGVYPAGFNKGMFAWYSNLALGRAVYISGLKPLVQSFHITKFLYWRAMGARVDFNIKPFCTRELPKQFSYRNQYKNKKPGNANATGSMVIRLIAKT